MAGKMTKKQLAAEFGVARSTLYYQPRLPTKDELLRQDILHTLALHPSYGHKRLALHLKVNKKRILRVMHAFEIKPYRRRGKKPWRPPSLSARYPNLLKGCFPDRTGIAWVSDFTYISFHGRFVYLATVMDVYSRRVVGWHISTAHNTPLVAGALFNALTNHTAPQVLHSDQGVECASQVYTELAERFGIRISMSAKASPWENGYQEAFFSTFKVDLGDPHRFTVLGQLVESIHLTLHIYNTYRIHTSLRMPPLQYLKATEPVSEKWGT